MRITSEEEITQKAIIQNLAEHNRDELRDNSTAAEASVELDHGSSSIADIGTTE
ncbi:MAG: hypothetical protein AB8V23_00125 [Candidatus Midichloria sp.]